ncbi:hypothetical protein BB559_003962 [Furculomyces boomerangus]|uniref:Activating signal cointegrator 1 complex subunit 3 n=1 Tax=Furculomyces boomerangus TaxID=61424 RepID=A0A2T9YHI4_9FUNG|nr:hypothetical protein BB559_003962 [Furculomyces boomerangus]
MTVYVSFTDILRASDPVRNKFISSLQKTNGALKTTNSSSELPKETPYPNSLKSLPSEEFYKNESLALDNVLDRIKDTAIKFKDNLSKGKVDENYAKKFIPEQKGLLKLRDPDSFFIPELFYDLDKLKSLLSEQRFDDDIPIESSTTWLTNQCKEVNIEGTSPPELFKRILDLICSNTKHFEESLIDIVGYDHMDFLTNVISRKTEIQLENFDYLSSENKQELEARIEKSKMPGVSVSMFTEKELKIIKMRNKANRRNKLKQSDDQKLIKDDVDILKGETLKQRRAEALMRGPNKELAKARSEPVSYPHVYTNEKSGKYFNEFGGKIALSAGHTNEHRGYYREITIPISKAPKKFEPEPIYVNNMDELCKYTLRGYKKLNTIQSIIYPTAYKTNENLLVCAPTGAGKTEIGLLAILRIISMYSTIEPTGDSSKNNAVPPKVKVDRKNFKVIYVAPMKALASEIVRKYSEKLQWLGVKVQELTGDMQLTRKEINSANVIVTTPEKWDVITRKSSSANELVELVRLLIIDEVHLLQDERGPVLESIVARTMRFVETSQSMIRVVGLSATLPNYIDVAEFLRVNLQVGLFYFGREYRPIPIEQHFIGVQNGDNSSNQSHNYMNMACYEKIEEILHNSDHQVMVFVHTRKDTVKSATDIKNRATNNNQLDIFDTRSNPQFSNYYNQLSAKSKNKELIELVGFGFGIHHAGMLRSDRRMVETMFNLGLIKVLCCTSTLAWGVNLPAHAVIIKGTQVYSLQKGGFSDLSVLDVLQIFGRAGRPQYEGDYGLGYIITSQNKVDDYVRLVSLQSPIESQTSKLLIDMLNAEIVLGSISSVEEAVGWLGYTFMFVRMLKNPLAYGIAHSDLSSDPMLVNFRRKLIINAANQLHKLQMIVFDRDSEQLQSKDLGRIASTFYLNHQTIERFNFVLKPNMSDADLFAVICMSSEFDQISVRESETKELVTLVKQATCCDIKGTSSDIETDIMKVNSETKSNILLQSIISRYPITDFGLISDAMYISQNAIRIIRALFEVAISRNYCSTASSLLILSICVEKRVWPFEHPLIQFDLPVSISSKLSQMISGDVVNSTSITKLRSLEAKELGQLVQNQRYGPALYDLISQFPIVSLSEYSIVPVTEHILQVELDIVADFEWSDKIHGGLDQSSERFYYFLENSDTQDILYNDYFLISRNQQSLKLGFTIPMPQEFRPELLLRVLSDRWHGSDSLFSINLNKLLLPSNPEPIQTKLKNLTPLHISVLKDERLVEMYKPKFSYFNPIQTQIFDTLYNSDENILLGAPTGSGKTLAAELAIFAAFKKYPNKKIVYIAPLKALVKERVKDWGDRLKKYLGYKLVELSGDVTPDFEAILNSDIIVTTPEKWDGISRRWMSVDYVKQVSLVVIDEIHLLGSDRGPILEAIVSRMNMISKTTKTPTRLIGLSTAVANAADLANWLNIKPTGLFNFNMSIRLVPLSIYIEKFGNKHYCPRMSSMNKPAFRCIKKLSPKKPVIIFVSSRRQTRLTANEIISFLGNESNPKQFLHMSNYELENILSKVVDSNLAFALEFGIGLHHAGLTDSDRVLVEELFESRKIQVLVATSTLAWGVNLPAHLVIVKGTEYFDAKSHGYKDMPMTDVLQMIGRAGRPQFDSFATAVVYVYEPKFFYYKKFLFAKFPVESNLPRYLTDHMNAEINSTKNISSGQEAMEYLGQTFLINRIKANPNFYGVDEKSDLSVNKYLSNLVMESFNDLEKSGCISFIEQTIDKSDILEDEQFPELSGAIIKKEKNSELRNSKTSKNSENIVVYPTVVGKISSKYYLSHLTMRILGQKMPNIVGENMFYSVFTLMCSVQEWTELPVRHNEDILNKQLNSLIKYKLPGNTDFNDPRTKTNILLQHHLGRLELPVSDYITDLRTVLDSSIRIIQSMIDFASYQLNNLDVLLSITSLLQCIKQACWDTDSPLSMFLPKTSSQKVILGELLMMNDKQLTKYCNTNTIDPKTFIPALRKLPLTKIVISNISVDQNQKCRVTVDLNFVFYKQSQYFKKNLGTAYCPKYGKFQYEGYFIIIGDMDTNSVLKINRLSNITTDKKRVELVFDTNTKSGSHCYTLFFINDAYLGIDQQFDFIVDI